jgi:hypothetical protein
MPPKKRGPPSALSPAGGQAATTHEADSKQLAAETSDSQAATANKNDKANASSKVAGKAPNQQPSALARGAPLLVLLVALLAAFASRKWPPDGLAARLTGRANSSSSSTAAAPASAATGDTLGITCNSSGNGSDSQPEKAWVEADARGFFPKGCKWREVHRKVGAAAAACLNTCHTLWHSVVQQAALPFLPCFPCLCSHTRVQLFWQLVESRLAASALLVANAPSVRIPHCPEQGEEPGFWDVRRYQYWDDVRSNWTHRQPDSCIIKGLANPGPSGWRWRNGSPRSAAHCYDKYCIYDNLWWVGWLVAAARGLACLNGCMKGTSHRE